MRIKCESCSATYTIDDAQIGDQPIGAQCPYCGHVKVVQRTEAVPGSDLALSSGSDLGFGPGSDLGFGGGDAGHDFGFGGSAPSAPGSSLDLGPSLDLDPRGLPPPYTAPPSAPGSSLDLDPSSAGFAAGELELGATAANASMEPGFGGGLPDPGAISPSVEPGAVCQECGTPLVDEFDKVIGLCELHQQDRSSTDFGPPSSPTVATWFARLPTGQTYGPLTLDELRERLRGGEVPLGAQFSNDGVHFQPLSAFKELAYLASLGVGGHAGFGARASYAPVRRRVDLGRYLTLGLGLFVLGGLGFFAWTQRAELVRIYEGIVADDGPTGPTRANPLRRYLASWRLAHPDVSGTAREHLLAADDHHLEDTWAGYERAERAYQRALLLDENDPEAIAGYVENLAIWRYPLASPREVAVARSALEYAMELAPDSGPVRRAVGALALAAGDLNGCRAGADAALERSPSDARARLVLAGCYVDGNVQLAVREAETARRARPALRRSDRVLAAAYRRGGRFRRAYQVLDERLEADPRNGAVHLEYGHLEASLARHEQAEARYRRAARLEGDKQAALLALGELALERREASRAVDAFRRAASVSPPNGRRGARLYAEWARAELARRAYDRAERLAAQALKFRPNDVPALLVMSEAALLSGSAKAAGEFVRRARKERSDEPVALILEGRVDIEQGRAEAGLQKMRLAAKNDPKDVRLLAVLAGAYLRAGSPAQAYATMRKAVEIDPARAHAIRRNTPLTVSEAALREAVRSLERSARDPRNTSVAYAAIGLVHHQLGESAAAARAVGRALSVDDANVLALIYEAQIALDRGEPARAERAANKLLLVERGSALGHLLRARVESRRGDLHAAREDYRSALRSNPGLLPAEIELAALDLEVEDSPEAAQARKVLERAFTIEPDSLYLRELLRRFPAE